MRTTGVKAVVIGGNGFIGSHLVDALLEANWRVTVYDRGPQPYHAPLAEVDYVVGELGNEGLLGPLLAEGDVVFHLASTTLPQSSNQAPGFDIQSNLVETVRLLELCVGALVAKVVFLSSGGTVYGVSHASRIGEEHATNPICSYGITKLSIEKYLHLFQHLYGLSYAVLRPSNPYGPRQNPAGSQGAVAVFLGRVAQGVPITIWGDGEVVRDYFHVRDLARACLLAATAPPPSPATENPVYNIGSGQGTSLNELLKIVTEVVDKPVTVERLPARAFDVSRAVLDIEKARTRLAWKPEISLQRGVLETWRWVRDRSAGGF